jgi:hypothetical protein
MRIPRVSPCFLLAAKQHAARRSQTGDFLQTVQAHSLGHSRPVKNGRAIFLEVKTENGWQSEDQKEFERRSLAAGAQYVIVRSIEDVQAIGL